MPNVNRMERFTQRARRVLTLAQEEASNRQQVFIDTPHVFVALIREEGGIAARALNELSITTAIADQLFETYQGNAKTTDIPMDLSASTKRTLELAVDEARRMGHHYIGTEHLLLGLMRLDDTPVNTLLASRDITPEVVREQVRQTMQEAPVSEISQPDRDKQLRVRIDNLEGTDVEFVLTAQQAQLVFHALMGRTDATITFKIDKQTVEFVVEDVSQQDHALEQPNNTEEK